MLIFPAIDILEGKAVRLLQGDYSRATVYGDDPVQVAADFCADGARWLHVVDLDGAREGRLTNLDLVRDIAALPGLFVQVGGGIRTIERIREVLSLGVDRVILGTGLTLQTDLWHHLFAEFGDRVVAGVDTRDGHVAIKGWTETLPQDGVDFARRLQDAGCQRVIHTDVSRDGAMHGPNLEAVREWVAALEMHYIASGGVTVLQDLAALAAVRGVEGAIVGRALYEGAFTLSQAIQLSSSGSVVPPESATALY